MTSRKLGILVFALVTFLVILAASLRPARGDEVGVQLTDSEKTELSEQLKLARKASKGYKGPRYDAIVLRNQGNLAREFTFQFFRTNKKGKVRAEPEESYELNLAGEGVFSHQRARFKRGYFVRVLHKGEELLRAVYVPVPNTEGRVLLITGGAEDPRNILIQQLQDEVNDLTIELAATKSARDALQEQITALQQQIADLRDGARLQVAISDSTPSSATVEMGSTDLLLAKFRFNADFIDGIGKSGITVRDSITGNADSQPSFVNLSVWRSGIKIAGPTNMVMEDDENGSVFFSLANTPITPKSGSDELELRGDVATTATGQAISGSAHTFSLAAADVTAVSASDPGGIPVTVVGKATANLVTVAGATLAISSSRIGASSGRTRGQNDVVANLACRAGGATDMSLGYLNLWFAGNTLSSLSPAFAVALVDDADQVVASTTAVWNASANQWQASLSPEYTIPAGTTKELKVRVDSSNFADQASFSDSFGVFLNFESDISFSDGVATFGASSAVPTLPYTVVTANYQ